MTDRQKNDGNSSSESASDLPRSFTPLNRRKDGALLRLVREQIRTGYYESSAVLKRIAEKITFIR